MSYRIHKVLGYGFDDLKYDKKELTDSRLNFNSFLLNEEEFMNHFDFRASKALEDYKKFLSQKDLKLGMDTPRSIGDLIDKGGVYVDNAVTFDSEFGSKKVICFTPLTLIKTTSSPWKRYGDHIDSYDSESKKNPYKPRVQIIKGGIYPFISNYEDRETGKRLDSWSLNSWLRNYDKLKGKDFSEATAVELYDLEITASELGYKTVEEARDRIVASPQPDIVNLLRWSGTINDENALYNLKPMLYTYWS